MEVIKMSNNNNLVAIHDNLKKLLASKAKALPKNFNETRFLQNCMVVLQDTKDIDKMTPLSVARTMLKGAFLNLDFFNRECYAIPYRKNIGSKQKPKWIVELQFQTDYRGEIKLVKKYSITQIKDIYAKVVRESDVFEEYVIDGRQTINFKPKPFNKGKIIGVFAVCIFPDDSIRYETMEIEEVEHIRDVYSKKSSDGKFSKMWRESFGEAAKKTVLHRLTKMFQLEFENIEQAQEYKDSSDMEFEELPEIKAKPIQMPKEIETEKETEIEEIENVEIENDENPTEVKQFQNDLFTEKGRETKKDYLISFCKDKKMNLSGISNDLFETHYENLNDFQLDLLEKEVLKRGKQIVQEI